MVRVCAVIKCYESSEYKIPNISFHAFPNDVERKQQWLEAINRPSFIPNKNSYICSKHFEQNCLVGNRLQKDACPSILEVPDIVLMKDILRQKLTTKAKQIEETQEVIASCSTTNVSGTKSVTPVRGVQIYSDTDHSSPLVSAKHLSKKFKANVGRSSTSSSVSSISGVIPIFQGIGTILQKKNKKSSTSTLTASETRNEIRKQVVMKKKENKRYINPKYVGDCLMDDMITPRISKRNWQIAKQQIIAQKRKIAYLLHRVKNINDLLKELKNKFNGRIQRISMVTEQMTEWSVNSSG